MAGFVGQPLRIRQRVAQFVGLGDSSLNLQFSSMALEFALFPRAPRRPQAETLFAKSEVSSWKWVARRVRDCLPGPHRKHAGVLDRVSVASAKVSRRVGRRRCREPQNCLNCGALLACFVWEPIIWDEPPLVNLPWRFGVSRICFAKLSLETLIGLAVVGCDRMRHELPMKWGRLRYRAVTNSRYENAPKLPSGAG